MTKSAPITTLQLIQIGNSVGVVLPKELLARLKLQKGDTVFVTKLTDGLKLSACSPETATQMSAARAVMRKRRKVLRGLAG